MSTFPNFDGTQHCAQPGVDPELFHPRQNGSAVHAKRICNSDGNGTPCPFLAGCREYGVTTSVHGVWGAWSEEERRADRKARHIVPEPLTFRFASGADITTNVPRRHGSWAGIGQHIAYKEPLCEECAEYRRAKRRQRYEEQKGQAS
jgi:hypothetical protein